MSRSPGSTARMDIHSIGNNAKIAEDVPGIVRTHGNAPRTQNPPNGPARQHAYMSNCSGNHVDTSDGPMDAYSIGNNAKTPENDGENVRKRQNDPTRMQYSHNGREIMVYEPLVDGNELVLEMAIYTYCRCQ